MHNDGKTRVFARLIARELHTEELELVSGGVAGSTCDTSDWTSHEKTYTGVTVDELGGVTYDNQDDNIVTDYDFPGHDF